MVHKAASPYEHPIKSILLTASANASCPPLRLWLALRSMRDGILGDWLFRFFGICLRSTSHPVVALASSCLHDIHLLPYPLFDLVANGLYQIPIEVVFLADPSDFGQYLLDHVIS